MDNVENWKKIERFENYSVSNLGNIRNDKTNKILKLTIHKNGYFTVVVKPYGRKGKCFCIKPHIEVSKVFIPNIYNKPQVNHIDGNKLNNKIQNLEWVTNSENMQHAWDNNLIPNFKENIQKLSKEDYEFIFENCRKNGGTMTVRELGKKFSISHTTIVRVLQGEGYSNFK